MANNLQSANNITQRYSLLLGKVAGIDPSNPNWRLELEQWIIKHPAKWWHGVWIASQIKGDPDKPVPPNSPNDIQLHKVFANAKLNVAENLLASGAGSDLTLIYWAEDGPRQQLSRVKLKEIAGRFASGFAGLGLQAGDKIVIDLPNTPEKLGAFLGASWLGLSSVFHFPWDNLDMQAADPWEGLNPKLILSCDGYRRQGKWVDCAAKISRLATKFHNKAILVPVPCAGSKQKVQETPNIMPWDKFQSLGQGGGLSYKHNSFNQELAKIPDEKGQNYRNIITGEWLLRDLSLWRLKVDVGLGCHSLYIGEQSHESWLANVSALGTGTDIVLYDGDISAMNNQIFWRIIEREAVKMVRLKASEITQLQKRNDCPNQNHQLHSVETVIIEGKLSTKNASFLKENCFENAEQVFVAVNQYTD